LHEKSCLERLIVEKRFGCCYTSHRERRAGWICAFEHHDRQLPISHSGLKSGKDGASAIWHAGVRKAVQWQAVCGFAFAGIIGIRFGYISGLSVGYGVLFSLLNGFWLAKRIEQSNRMDLSGGQRFLYAGAVIRFLLFLFALIVASMTGLQLLAVAGGLLVAQVAMYAYAVRRARNEMNSQEIDTRE